jgi:transposase InsO family protein
MGGLLRERECVKFAFIDAEKADDNDVAWMCRTLGVSRSGYYAWRSRPESTHAKQDRRLAILIRAAHDGSRKTYGWPRVFAELKAQGLAVSNKRVARIMRQQGLKARVRRRYKNTTMSDHDQPVADNLLARRFEAEAPNQRWVGDTTELLIGESGAKAYLAAIVDLFSRFVVGWALSAVNDRHHTLKALEMAVRRRCPDAGLLHHSDQGSPYASEDYQRELAAHGIVCSMSRRGNCHDNAAMESWFSTLKFELGERFESYASAKEQLFDYIEVFYNQKRRHSSIAYRSPAQHERLFRSIQMAA